jgi:predicted lipid-binding transport protein (Tim44 family)
MIAMFVVAFCIVSLNPVEARMGGSFGSRGTRTFQSAPATRTAPSVGPIQRSMTPNQPAPASPVQSFPAQSRPSFWSGFGGGVVGGLLGGLVFNGIFGMMFGHGFGGVGGGFSLLFQLLLIGGVVLLAVRFFRRRDMQTPQSGGQHPFQFGPRSFGNGRPPVNSKGFGGPPAMGADRDEIGITGEVQDAFTREDHQGLRRLTTPEMVSYLSEELADNATHGLKNEVSDLRFLSGDVAEAWREDNRDYATMAMHWSAKDLMRNRQTGAVEKGDPEKPIETTELWTFTRDAGGPWLLSAIQDARSAAA